MRLTAESGTPLETAKKTNLRLQMSQQLLGQQDYQMQEKIASQEKSNKSLKDLLASITRE